MNLSSIQQSTDNDCCVCHPTLTSNVNYFSSVIHLIRKMSTTSLFVLLIAFISTVPVTDGVEIITRPSDQSVDIGSIVRLPCVFASPPTLILWRFQGPDSSMDNLFTCLRGSTCKLESRFSDYAEVSFAANGLTINGVRKRNNGIYSCRGAHGDDQVTVSARITVRVLPSKPVIYATQVVYKEGQSITLNCSSVNGNPMPRLIWSRHREIESSTALPPGTTPTQNKLFGTTTSLLTFTATAEDDQAIIHCAASNDVATVNSTALLLNVKYKPKIDRFPYNPYKFVEGDLAEIPCRARGNPQPSVSWTISRGGSKVTSASTLVFRDVRRTRAGGYTCTATNSEASVQRNLTLEIHYPPTILLPRTHEFLEFNDVLLPCRVEAFPKASITWKMYKPPGRTWDDSILSFKRITRDLAGKYTCIASNTLRPSGRAPQDKRSENETNIVVLYPPGMPTVDVSPGRTIVVGTPVTLSCISNEAAPGVPAPSFLWTNQRNGAPVSRDADFRIKEVRLADNTEYRCVASNSQGSAPPVSVILNVDERPRFLPRLLPSELSVRVDQSDAFQMECIVRGKPAPEVIWKKNDMPIPDSSEYFTQLLKTSNVEVFSYKIEATLQWKGKARSRGEIGLRPEDNAVYTCLAKNNKETVRRDLNLRVKYKPQFPTTQRKVATAMLSSVSLRCIISAVPLVTRAVWKLGTDRTVSSGGRYFIQDTRDIPRRTFTSTLTISRVVDSDLGTYQCLTDNTEGTGRVEISLQRQSVPERPEVIKVVEDTWESMLLSWKAPFDGGFPQRLQLMVEGSGKRLLKTVDSSIVKYNLTGLLPRVNYTVSLRASNKLGSGPFSDPVRHLTKNLFIPRIEMIKLSTRTRTLTFSGARGYCVRVETSQDGGRSWNQYRECLKPESESLRLTDNVVSDTFRGFLCLQRRPEVCSEPMVAEIVESIPDIPTKTIIVVACVCALVILVLVIVLLYFCCKRRRPRKSDYEANPAHRRPQAMAVQFPSDAAPNESSNSLTSGKPYAMVPPSGHHDASPAYPEHRYDTAKPPVFATSQSSKDPLLASFADSGSDPPSPRRLVSSFSSNTVGRPTSNEALRLLATNPGPQGPLHPGPTDNQSMDLPMTPLTVDGRTMSPTPNGDSTMMKPKKVIYEVVV